MTVASLTGVQALFRELKPTEPRKLLISKCVKGLKAKNLTAWPKVANALAVADSLQS